MIMKLEGSTAGAPKPDPIFALIAEHQAAYYGMEALYDENDEDNPLYLDAEDAELEKLKLLVVTKPETFAGLVAFAEYVVSYFATQVSWFPSEPSENALATISQVLHDFAPGGTHDHPRIYPQALHPHPDACGGADYHAYQPSVRA